MLMLTLQNQVAFYGLCLTFITIHVLVNKHALTYEYVTLIDRPRLIMLA